MRQAKKLSRRPATQTIERLEARTHLSVTMTSEQIGGASYGVLHIMGTAGNDVVGIWVNNSNQLVVTENGKDYKFGRFAAARVWFAGLAGNDRIEIVPEIRLRLEAYGGPGNDTLIGSQAHDILVGGLGDDYIVSGTGNDALIGDAGADRMLGGDGIDTIVGGDGNDTINSGAGNDVVNGGTGTNAIDSGDAITFNPLSQATFQPQAYLSNVIGYDPAQIRRAYGLGALDDMSYTNRGQGQTIYIVAAFTGANTYGDLVTFSQQFDLPTPVLGQNFVVVNAGGRTPARNASWASEANLDVQWAHAIAPDAKIVLVQADSDLLVDMYKATNLAGQMASADGGGVVSMSFGVEGTFPGLPNWDSMFHSYGKVSFIAASGDGSLVYPAFSPYVTSVGGTTLTLDSDGNRTTEETAWVAGGAGLSPIHQRPSYQDGVIFYGVDGLPLNVDSRGVADVSYNGDFDTPYAIYISTAQSGYLGWFTSGGTSAGAPQWAALVALANQKRKDVGKAPLGGGLDGILYDLNNNGLLTQRDDPSDNSMNDVIIGTALGFPANIGYDLATGLGTPRSDLLVNQLSTFEPFYIQGVFKFSATLVLAPNTPTGAEQQPLNNILAGQPRAGSGTISGSDQLSLVFVTDNPNYWYDPNSLSTNDNYFDVDEGEASATSVRLYRTGRGENTGAIYGYGTVAANNTDLAYADAIPTAPVFYVKFEGTWSTGADGQTHYDIYFRAVDPVTGEYLPDSPYQHQYDGGAANYGAYFEGELHG